MGFPITKTTTATGMKKGGVAISLITGENNKQFVAWSQGYVFVDENDEPVTELQKANGVSGNILLTELETEMPDIFNALSAIWEFLDSEIRRQEGLD